MASVYLLRGARDSFIAIMAEHHRHAIRAIHAGNTGLENSP
jgi:hypothetical protein